jgi:hypothetical protein
MREALVRAKERLNLPNSVLARTAPSAGRARPHPHDGGALSISSRATIGISLEVLGMREPVLST